MDAAPPPAPLTVILELTPDEAETLTAQARAQGTDIETLLHRIIAQLTPTTERPSLTEKQKAAIALLDAWRDEDATDDDEELARRDAEFEEFKTNINRWRTEEGRPPAFR
jgi:hypothetical protein